MIESQNERINKAKERYPCRCNACGSRLVWQLLAILKPDKTTGVYLSPTGLKFGIRLEDTDPDNFVSLWKNKEVFKDAKPIR